MRKLLLASMLLMGLSIAATTPKGVVMDFGALDTIDALEGSQSVLAVPKQNVPEYLTQYTTEVYQSSGGMKEPNIDLIREINPDFIVISGRQGSFIEILEDIAPVINFSAGKDYLSSAKANILAVGKAIGKEQEAADAWDQLSESIQPIIDQAQASSKTAVVVLHNKGNVWLSNNSGYATLIHDVLGVKRAETEATKERQEADAQYLTDKNPDIIFIIDRSAAIGDEPLALEYFENEKFENIQAVKDGKVITLNPKLWYLSGRGLQSLALQAEEVSKALD